MKTHDLKISEEFYEEVEQGNKRFEIRRNDRDFQKGDKVTLFETTNHGTSYTGRSSNFFISYVTSFEQKDNFVVFGIEDLICKE